MNKKLPQHLAIIMDGNGRWAEERGLLRSEGHRTGVDVVRVVVSACLEKHIPVLSLWAFGSENWSRPPSEVDFLMQLFLTALEKEIQELHQRGVCVRFTGQRAQLSDKLREQMYVAEKLTQDNEQLILNIVINYGGKWDILQATQRLAKKVTDGVLQIEQIDEAAFSECLDTYGLPDPDLFIRTSGEQRISNFFLWQLAYTEFYFSPVNWPDFTTDELNKALDSYATRERRYGKTSNQLIENNYV